MTITKDMINNAINALGSKFDSHEVILKLAHDNQRAYVEALYETNSDTPFHKLHTSLGTQIKEICLSLGFKNTDSHSKDIFGQSSKCLSWIKQ